MNLVGYLFGIINISCCLFITTQSSLKRYPIIPQPLELIEQKGFFALTTATQININMDNAEIKQLVGFIADYLAVPLGGSIKINHNCQQEDGNITIIIDPCSIIEKEGYHLCITSESIKIVAHDAAGAFYAFQTIRQLLPSSAQKHIMLEKSMLLIPCAEIKDSPRFGYRGLMLDVARHMFSVEFIKKFIDIMALYKFNRLHWHLVDDQGWRIEIKKYPRLQEIAAYRNSTAIGHSHSYPCRFDGNRYGGYYTQNEIKEIVRYAQEQHVIIIPEIEMPGHCMAVLAAYPELGCTGGPYVNYGEWGIYHDVYCAGNEKVFEFLQDVLIEVLAMFPSKFIHIGGDEVYKKRWHTCIACQRRIQEHGLTNEEELQSYFIKRIEQFLNSHNRSMIGWDEILEGGIAPNATVMSWRGIIGGIKAARLDHNVIMTPYQDLYFDRYQLQDSCQPLAIGGFLPLQKVYQYEPIPDELTSEQASYILGAQANIWTEYIPTSDHVEYMTFPRALALAEVCWTSKQNKNYAAFAERLKYNLEHLKALHVAYCDYK